VLTSNKFSVRGGLESVSERFSFSRVALDLNPHRRRAGRWWEWTCEPWMWGDQGQAFKAIKVLDSLLRGSASAFSLKVEFLDETRLQRKRREFIVKKSAQHDNSLKRENGNSKCSYGFYHILCTFSNNAKRWSRRGAKKTLSWSSYFTKSDCSSSSEKRSLVLFWSAKKARSEAEPRRTTRATSLIYIAMRSIMQVMHQVFLRLNCLWCIAEPLKKKEEKNLHVDKL
jgi:hypothetical protein